MPQAARSPNQEYWRPANSAADRLMRPNLAATVCPRCGVDYSPGAKFCAVCGSDRAPRPIVRLPLAFADYFDLEIIRQRLGLSVACLVFFIAGIVCMVIAATLGLFYKPTTLADWQAVQLWRIEWLLAAVVLMLAGILLKKRGGT